MTPAKPMTIAMLVPDNRDEYRTYDDPRPCFGPAPTALLDGLGRLPDCTVHIVCCVQRPVQSPAKLAENIHYHSVVVGKWGWMRGGYLGCVAAVRKILRQVRPDIVHGQGTERYCALSAVLSGYPNMITLHGNMRSVVRVNRSAPLSFLWLTAKFEGFTVARADGIICLSRYARRLVEGARGKTWIIPNAVDEGFFGVDRAPDSKPLLLCVGSVFPHKNQNGLIQALDPLAAKLGFQLVFLGSAIGWEYDRHFLRLVESRPWCHYAGFADRATFRSYLRRATLLVHPSFEDNCPMAVLEAMAAGVPVAASAIGGIPDLIEDGRTGWLFDPTDEGAIRAAVSEACTSGEVARERARRAKESALERYRSEPVARRHREAYGDVVFG